MTAVRALAQPRGMGPRVRNARMGGKVPLLDRAWKIDYERRFIFRENEMSDTLPDRLSVNPKSPHYDEKLLEKGVGIKFNGAEKTNVEEYCVSEGWIRVVAGKSVDRFGNPMTIKLKGTVEPYVKMPEA
jgi:hypothetical protein